MDYFIKLFNAFAPVPIQYNCMKNNIQWNSFVFHRIKFGMTLGWVNEIIFGLAFLSFPFFLVSKHHNTSENSRADPMGFINSASIKKKVGRKKNIAYPYTPELHMCCFLDASMRTTAVYNQRTQRHLSAVYIPHRKTHIPSRWTLFSAFLRGTVRRFALRKQVLYVGYKVWFILENRAARNFSAQLPEVGG